MSVLLETSLGDIVIDLFTKDRPRCSTNFLKLCKLKMYNYCLFHSVQRNFVIQTGDIDQQGGCSVFKVLYGDQAKLFEKEEVPKLKHNQKLTVSMVNDGNGYHGSQFLITTTETADALDGLHTVFGIVSEGADVIQQINESYCDEKGRPYQDIRIHHTIILHDPFPDPPMLPVPPRSPSPPPSVIDSDRLAVGETVNKLSGHTTEEILEYIEEKELRANTQMLEIIGDIPDAEVKPPENVLFVCKLNPVTSSDDLEIIFSRFGEIESCEVIRDWKTGDSLCYAFIEFTDVTSCEAAYFKMDNVLIDERRIHVDFSQSVSRLYWNRNTKHQLKYSEQGNTRPGGEKRPNNRSNSTRKEDTVNRNRSNSSRRDDSRDRSKRNSGHRDSRRDDYQSRSKRENERDNQHSRKGDDRSRSEREYSDISRSKRDYRDGFRRDENRIKSDRRDDHRNSERDDYRSKSKRGDDRDQSKQRDDHTRSHREVDRADSKRDGYLVKSKVEDRRFDSKREDDSVKAKRDDEKKSRSVEGEKHDRKDAKYDKDDKEKRSKKKNDRYDNDRKEVRKDEKRKREKKRGSSERDEVKKGRHKTEIKEDFSSDENTKEKNNSKHRGTKSDRGSIKKRRKTDKRDSSSDDSSSNEESETSMSHDLSDKQKARELQAKISNLQRKIKKMKEEELEESSNVGVKKHKKIKNKHKK